jgi:transposase
MGARSNYTAEYRAEAVRLAGEPGSSLKAVAGDLGLSPDTLSTWRRRARLAEAPPPLGADERAELVELRRRVKVLETEREILKKAAAFFAQESDRTR